ncbi:MAG: phosphatidate cytidylyltransferase [Gammaproteobacteria bacterium]|nr:phosphatidate cytidylyltransferase [Gammaproteobacteria bacterium]
MANSELKSRVITASVLAAVILFIILLAPSWAFISLIAVFVFIAADEWALLANVEKRSLRFIFSLFVLLAAYGFYLYFTHVYQFILLLVVSMWWLLVLVKLARAKIIVIENTFNILILLAALATLVPLVAVFELLHSFNPVLVVYLLFVIWAADIGAYFSGKQWGKNKLAPVISPGKSIEGAVGAVVATFVMAFVGLQILPLGDVQSVYFYALIFIVTLASIVGDLFESFLKRKHSVKDSGSLLPGHGGVLDRIDSLTAAAPVFVMGLLWLEVL